MKNNNLNIKNIDSLSPVELDEYIKMLSLYKMTNLEKSLQSKDPSSIIKAKSYINSISKNNNAKAFMFDPFSPYTDGNGFKRKNHQVGYEVLKNVAKHPIVKTVHNTRIFQIQNFLKFSNDDQKQGFNIRRKKSIFTTKTKEVEEADKSIIEEIVEFLMNSRRPIKKNSKSLINFDAAKWDEYPDFDDWVRLIVNDTYTFDQIATENIRNRKFELLAYKPIDASTVRYLDTIDNRFKDSGLYDADEVNGFLPKYGQVKDGQILHNEQTNQPIVWYPWELSFAIRNGSTDIYSNQYGLSELEVLTDVITYFLYGFQYNGNFFKNGSNPKGILNIEDEIGSVDVLKEFKQDWRATIKGPGNEHRIPTLVGTKANFIKMQENNRDMEFHKWIEFLIVMICSVYCIDPSELGFNFQNSQMFGQDGQKQRLNHSREKGLKPMLNFLQKYITKFIVSEINSDFEFVFTGVDLEDETAIIENDKKKMDMGAISLEDIFEKYSGRKITDNDTILNNIAFQYKSQLKYGGQNENAIVDKENGGENIGVKNPFDAFEKESETNPIVKSATEYINKNLRS